MLNSDVELNGATYGALITARGSGEHGQQARALFGATWQPNVISYIIGIIACEKGGQWQHGP